MTEKHIYFVRHGESQGNATTTDLGDASLLTKRGRDQARQAGARLRATAAIQIVLASPYPRAAETAAEIARCLCVPVEPVPHFVQRRRPSCLLGKSHFDEEARGVMEQVFRGYVVPNHRHSDEENLDDLRARTTRALAFLEARPETTLCVVTHGMFLRALVCSMLAGPEFPGRLFQGVIDCLEPANCGITYVRLELAPPLRIANRDPVWRIISWNGSDDF